MNEFWDSRLILKVRSGSHSYGTNLPESDEDFKGICIPPSTYLLGLDHFEQKEHKEPDEVIYSLSKFTKLALDNNPNILEALFVDEKFIIHNTEFGIELRSLRKEFLSKRAHATYGGYALSQLKKMTTVDKNAIGKRAINIEKYSYDTKNAMHLIRLLKMGIEVLAEGELKVFRDDRAELLSIRQGKYSKAEIEGEASRLREELRLAYERSKLPEKPNYNKINDWLVSAHKRSLDWSGNSGS